ncbi:cytochrome c oxidase subunit II [soil metagenome]
MVTTAIVLSLILLVVVLFLLFRISALAAAFRRGNKEHVSKSNKVNGFLFLVFLVVGGIAFVWSWVSAQDEFMIPNASVHGKWIDDMFWQTMIILGIVFVATQVLLFWYSYKFQYQEGKKAFYFPHNNKLEIIWTAIPAVVMSLLVFNGWQNWTKITGPAPEDAVVMEILGKQFNWKVRYPGADNQLGRASVHLIDANNEMGVDFSDPNSLDDIVPRELHIPKGMPVMFNIRSLDVLHAPYMPHFKVHMYAVPGMPTRFWFVPTKTTDEMRQETGNPDFNYEIACSQICGTGHYAMRLALVVDEPEDYLAWLAQQPAFIEEHPEVLANIKPNNKQLVLSADAAEGDLKSEN